MKNIFIFIENKVYYILVRIMVLFMLSVMSKALWGSYLPLNNILGAIIFVLVALIFIVTFKRKDLFIIIPSFVLILLGFTSVYDFSILVKDSVYWILTTLFLWKLCDNSVAQTMYKELKNAKSFLIISIVTANLLLCIAFFIPTGYLTNFTGTYYVGFSKTPHSIGAAVCLLLVVTLAAFQEKEIKFWYLFCLIPGIYAIFESGARIYLIPLAILLVIIYINYIKSKTVKIVLLPIAALSLIYLFINSGMIEKFKFVIGNQYISLNKLAQISSGRTEIWLIDWLAFKEYNLISKLIGSGFDEIYLINYINYGLKISGHNDIIHILMGIGLCGVLIYLFVLFIMLMKIVKNSKKMFVALLLIAYPAIAMLINGFFLYQTFVYSFVFLFLLLTQNIKNEEKIPNGQKV